MGIILSILPWGMLIWFFTNFHSKVKNKIKKLDDAQKEILKNGNNKIKNTKVFFGILMVVLVFLIYFYINFLEVSNDCVLAALLTEPDEPLVLESISSTYDNIVSAVKLPLDIMVSFIITYYVFLIYVEKTKKLEDNERKILIDLYSGRAVSGIIIIIVNTIYKVFVDLVMTPAAKPIIYLYPEKQENVSVKVSEKGRLTCTYPKYNDGWNVIAYPDGTLEDNNGKKYYALYWEGLYKVNIDETKGFCVKGEDTIKFLEEKLAILGLNEREAQEFIVYWLPQLEKNKYNYIYFKQTEEVDEVMGLDINPKPDSVIRILMVFKALNKEIKVEEQQLERPARKGFTVVEWGGTKL